MSETMDKKAAFVFFNQLIDYMKSKEPQLNDDLNKLSEYVNEFLK